MYIYRKQKSIKEIMIINMVMKYLLPLLLCISTIEAEKINIEWSDPSSRSLSNEVWTWTCEKNICEKSRLEKGDRPVGPSACRLVCPKGGGLWPRPTTVELSTKLLSLNPHSVHIQTKRTDHQLINYEAADIIQQACDLFTDRVSSLDKQGNAKGRNLEILLVIKNPEVFRFTQGADESYQLNLSSTTDDLVNVTIEGNTFLGVRHGLETLSQMIVSDPMNEAVLTPGEAAITDSPSYTHRGIALDTARNFISLAGLKRTLDGMAANKLNTFHWHITDSHSFPFYSTTYPNFTLYGAYSQEKVYTERDIKELVQYGIVRGIRVVPELDAPAHVGEGWQWAPDTTVCVGAEPWQEFCVEPPCGQLDPTNQEVYKILGGLYQDMSLSFVSDLFHMGGDEVNINCWNSTERILRAMTQQGIELTTEGFHSLWAKFQEKARQLLAKANPKARPILWTSTLTEGNHLTKYLNSSDYIIQIWTKKNDPVIAHLVNNGFPVIFSNYDALYFDCGFGAWVGAGNNWCSPYIPWQKVYENDPKTLLKSLGVDSKFEDLALGAEAALWTEQADDSSIDNRLWPRAAAMAEVLWSGPATWESAQHRFLHHRDRLVSLGIQADTVQPEWCYQNQGSCYLKS